MKIHVRKLQDNRVFTFTSGEADPEDTSVIIRHLPKRLQCQIKDNTLQMDIGRIDGQNKLTVAQNTTNYMMVVESIVGWRNVEMVTDDGTNVPLDFTNDQKTKEMFLNSLTEKDYDRLVKFVNNEDE